jgi:hypothetical protein
MLVYKMFLNTQPKTFVIALKDHEISRKQLQDCLTTAQKYNWSIEVFWGINGKTITENSWNDIGVKPLYHKGSMDKPGTWGCFFSHWNLWHKCIELNEPIIILEHDALIEDFWKPFEIVSLTKLHENYSLKKLHKWVDDDSGICSSSTHAYCILPEHARALINFSKSVGAFATDRMIGDKVVPITHLGTPSLVSRQNNYSTTENL